MSPTAESIGSKVIESSFKQSVQMTEHAVNPPASSNSSPAEIATAFCNKIQAAFDAQDVDAIVGCFTPDGWWRDILNIDFDFNSLKTSQIKESLGKFGVPKIKQLKVIKPHDAVYTPAANWLHAYLTYETELTRGKGFVRLRESAPGRGDWKAFTFFTALWEVKGHEEFAHERRPLGAEHGEHTSPLNWLEKREQAARFEDSDPTVLIVGGGQNGLALAARLTALRIPNLVVEKHGRVGDSWRLRYHTLCLHDPVWADEMPYLPYPPHWPIYTPKDKIANFFEHYAEIMELNIWLKSTIEPNPVFDNKTKKWAVTVTTEGKSPRKMNVSHLVLASGFSGEARLPKFPQDEFQGKSWHSSRHPGGQGWKGKKVVVVGCCNSGHDISADLYENGADVTMVQRSSTYVMSSKYGIPGLLAGVYEEGGPSCEDADIMLTSLPIDLLAEFHVGATKDIAEKDKDILDGLTKAGFKLNHYPQGLFIKYFRDGGGYYIDVGASTMIAEGKIKIKQGVEIKKLTKDGVLFEDGTELKADLVVFATGYDSMRTTVKRVISEDVAKRIGPCWGQDAQGEIPGVWRNSGVENFYLQVGNMFQARCFSKHVATQIQMTELGLAKSVYPEYKKINDPRF
ncbi:dimethylaniline monooxygenase [Meredithblackwellia eburnea MCA 4105]